MPFSPEEGNRRSILVTGIVRLAEEQMNARIARVLAAGSEPPMWATQKQAQLGHLMQALNDHATATMAQVRVAVNEAVPRAYSDGSSAALRDLEAIDIAGVVPQAQALALLHIADEITGKVQAGLSTVLRSIPDIYRRIVGETVAQMTLGLVTRRQATQTAVDLFAAEGLTSFVDAAGRTWNLGSYTEMATRTGTARAAVDGHLQTLAANGNDLVYIIPGPRACPICDTWAGKVLSISGSTPGHTTMAQARAAGWGHPNCRCATGIYLRGVTDPSPIRPNDSGFENAQRQRVIERTIRKYKAHSVMAMTPLDRAAADRKVRQWQAVMRAHLQAHPDLKRLPYRETAVKPRRITAGSSPSTLGQ